MGFVSAIELAIRYIDQYLEVNRNSMRSIAALGAMGMGVDGLTNHLMLRGTFPSALFDGGGGMVENQDKVAFELSLRMVARTIWSQVSVLLEDAKEAFKRGDFDSARRDLEKAGGLIQKTKLGPVEPVSSLIKYALGELDEREDKEDGAKRTRNDSGGSPLLPGVTGIAAPPGAFIPQLPGSNPSGCYLCSGWIPSSGFGGYGTTVALPRN